MSRRNKGLAAGASLPREVHALSNVDLARLLRSSFQFRNQPKPRKRLARGSPRYIPKQWTAKEIQLVGTDTDRVIAAKLGCTFTAVSWMRRKLGLPSIRSRRPWTEQELSLLGGMSDDELARKIHRTPSGVKCMRNLSGLHKIPPGRAWTRAEIDRLGTEPDKMLARKFKRTLHAVQHYRAKLGIPCFAAPNRPWTQEEESLLGTMPDDKLAKRLKRPLLGVRGRRFQKRIFAFRSRVHRWTAADDKLLRLPTIEVAKKLGVTVVAVRHRRIKLGIRLKRVEG